jgi:NAD(P)-dependent dehydrogenase (short-subunit alcohol dehydrogenase family)
MEGIKDQMCLVMKKELNLEGKTALVTGGATRIGREICLTLAAAGAAVAVHYKSSKKDAEALVESIIRDGGKAVSIQADLTSESACVSLIESVSKHQPPLGILVNNASVFTKEPIKDVTEKSLLGEFWPNVFAPILLSRCFAATNPRDGVIINLLDRRICANDAQYFSYSLTKKSLADFTKLAAVALAPNIKVHGIAPGPILPPSGQDANYLAEKGGLRLLDDTLDPSAISNAVMALLSLRGATGQILHIDGGQHLLGNGI